jgi:hypothetical protein
MINSSSIKLPPQEWERIIELGVENHIKELESELARTAEKIRAFEAKYKMSFAQLEAIGLPENSTTVEHEDYVEWSSWEGYLAELKSKLTSLRALVEPSNVR